MVTYGFYNSVNHDRRYDAVQFGSMFDGIIKDGIFMSIGGHFNVTASDGMMLLVDTGRAWFNHTWTLNDSFLPIYVPESEIILDRIDAVVIDVNSDPIERKNDIILVKGTPSKTPQRPTMIKTTNHHQYPLAYISVKAGVTDIRPADISIVIGTAETPYVTGILETVSIDDLLAKWQDEWQIFYDEQTSDIKDINASWAQEWEQWYNSHTTEWKQDFTNWFETVKDTLADDPAGLLAEHVTNMNNPHETTANQVGAVGIERQDLTIKQKAEARRNIDAFPTFYIKYTEDNKEEALDKLNNPQKLTETPLYGYCIIFNDVVGDSMLHGGVNCIFGHTSGSESGDYATQLALKYGLNATPDSFLYRTRRAGEWCTFVRVADGGNAHTLSGLTYDKFAQKFQYTTSETANNTYYKIRIKEMSDWMTSFVISLYQSYDATMILISGYDWDLEKKHWYSPKASIIGCTNGIESINVLFGYDSDDYLFVIVPKLSYTGLLISHVNEGYRGFQTKDLTKLFEVTPIQSITGTIQKEMTIFRPYYLDDFDIDELKNSVSNGKAQVASAITEKDVPTAADATFKTMADHIKAIKTGFADGAISTGNFSNIYGNMTLNVQISSSPYEKADVTFLVIAIEYCPRAALPLAGDGTTKWENTYATVNASYAFTSSANGSIANIPANSPTMWTVKVNRNYNNSPQIVIKHCELTVRNLTTNVINTVTLSISMPSKSPSDVTVCGTYLFAFPKYHH